MNKQEDFNADYIFNDLMPRDEDGRPHGTWITNHLDSDKMKHITEYVHGSIHGSKKSFSPLGGTLVSDIKFRNNCKHGECIEYNLYGQIMNLTVFSMGKPNGRNVYFRYHNSGGRKLRRIEFSFCVGYVSNRSSQAQEDGESIILYYD